MNARTLLDNFDLIADAPGGVPKLRELILQLAVRGKLVPQDPKDEPAEKDLKEIAEPGTIPYAIPRGWRWTTLRSISRDLGQKVPDKRFTYIDVSAIDKDRGRIGEDPQIINANDAPSRARKIVHTGTVIYSTIRPYLLNIAVVDREFDPDPIVSTAFFVMHPFACVVNRYLFYYLRSQPFTEYVSNAMTGMAYPAVNDSTMSVAPFPLPPLPEQKRIVAKVDELMKRCDELESRQKERVAYHKTLVASCLNAASDPQKPNPNFIIHNSSFNLLFSSPESITELRKTILQLAVQGRIVHQDPREESAAKLFKCIQSEQAKLISEGICKSFKPLPPIREVDKPFRVSLGWEWFRLRELVFTLGDGLHGTPEYSEGTECYFINGNHCHPIDTVSRAQYPVFAGVLELFARL